MRCPDIWRVSTKFQLNLFENLLIHHYRGPPSLTREGFFVSFEPKTVEHVILSGEMTRCVIFVVEPDLREGAKRDL